MTGVKGNGMQLSIRALGATSQTLALSAAPGASMDELQGESMYNGSSTIII